MKHVIDRRSLFRGMASAGLLAPLAGRLISEAQGQLPKVHRLVTVVSGNGMDHGQFTPLGQRKEDLKARGVGDGDLIDSREFELPPQYQSFAPVRDRLLLIDGLPNRNGRGHTGSYVGFACTANVGNGEQGGPGGITFDQYVAKHVAANTPFRSVVLGVSGREETITYTGTSATGRSAPVPILCRPTTAYAKIFGLVQGSGADDALRAKTLLRRYSVMTAMKEEIATVRAGLVGTERQKLEQFMTSVENSEARLRAIEQSSLAPGCNSMQPGFSDAVNVEGRVLQNFEIAKNALSCGLTNVVTLCAGTSSTWDLPRGTLGLGGWHSMGHGGDGGPPAYAKWIDWLAAQSVGLLNHLAQFPEGDGTMADHTLLVFMNDNGEQHHGRYFRWPMIIVGNGGGMLKADGRYIRYPVRTETSDTEHSLAEVYNTLSRVFGAPVDNFGKFDGAIDKEPSNGPLAELMA